MDYIIYVCDKHTEKLEEKKADEAAERKKME